MIQVAPEQIIRERLARKLPTVYERINSLPDKHKLHHVLHAAYRPGVKTIEAGKKLVRDLTSVEEKTSRDTIPKLLENLDLKKLQKIDRLVKPDPRIYIHQGHKVSFDDIKTLGRSPIEREIQARITPIDLNTNPEKLLDNLGAYGFAILDTQDTDKETIARAFEQAKDYLTSTDLETKKLLSVEAPDIDAKYRVAKKGEQIGNGYRSMENITAPRPFIFDNQYELNWKMAEAMNLKSAFVDLASLLEVKAQQVLEHIEKLFKLSVGSFAEAGRETNQSTLRLIHCISEQEQSKHPNSYFDNSTKAQSVPNGEPKDSCVGIHTDWGLLTVLPAATAPGLEFWYNDVEGNGKNSGWVSLNSKPGELIIMPGNVAEIVSGGKLKSVPHRVKSQGDRFSFAYFTEVDTGTNIDLLRQTLIDQGAIDANRISLFEEEVRPYLVNPEQPLTGENYLLYMLHRNTAVLDGKIVEHARQAGLFLKNN